MCNDAEVCFSIVEAVMIDMVDDEASGRLQDYTVHLNVDSLSVFAGFGVSAGVTGVLAPGGIPFVLI